jgi:hypothetical protein
MCVRFNPVPFQVRSEVGEMALGKGILQASSVLSINHQPSHVRRIDLILLIVSQVLRSLRLGILNSFEYRGKVCELSVDLYDEVAYTVLVKNSCECTSEVLCASF